MSGRLHPAWLALLLLPPAIWACQRQVDARLQQGSQHIEPLLVWSGETVRRSCPGLEAVMADLYWLRAVQYFGSERHFNPDSHFELLEPLIRITVSLDPRFLLAYRYGAFFLAERWPSGVGKPEAAEKLLQEGIEANPRRWELRWSLATIRFLSRGDRIGAAEALQSAVGLPDAPIWLETLAGRLLSDADQRQTARVIWQELYRQNQGAIRENALLNLQYLDAADVLDALRVRIDAYHERQGSWPPRLADVQATQPPALPLEDPSGVPFRYDAQTGRVNIDPTSILWPLLPTEEQK